MEMSDLSFAPSSMAMELSQNETNFLEEKMKQLWTLVVNLNLLFCLPEIFFFLSLAPSNLYESKKTCVMVDMKDWLRIYEILWREKTGQLAINCVQLIKAVFLSLINI